MRLVKVKTGKQGTQLAPDRISAFVREYFANEAGKISVINNDTLESIQDFSEFTVFLGGDNKATEKSFDKFLKEANPGIIVFSATPKSDLMKALTFKGLKEQNIIYVGLRNWPKGEYVYLRNRNIKQHGMREMSFEVRREICDHVMSEARQWGSIYATIDIGVLDPAFVNVLDPEPGGMTTRDLLYFIQRLKVLKNFKAADIVNVNPNLEVNDITSKTAAKIVVELA